VSSRFFRAPIRRMRTKNGVLRPAEDDRKQSGFELRAECAQVRPKCAQNALAASGDVNRRCSVGSHSGISGYNIIIAKPMGLPLLTRPRGSPQPVSATSLVSGECAGQIQRHANAHSWSFKHPSKHFFVDLGRRSSEIWNKIASFGCNCGGSDVRDVRCLTQLLPRTIILYQYVHP